MKKLFYSLLAGVTMLASCQKDADLAMDGDGGMVDVTVTAAMEGASATTRAIESFGTGAKVDRCIMEVYLEDGTLYKRMVSSDISEATESGGTRAVTFDLRLVSDKTYNFLFWADDSDGFSGTADSTDPDNPAGADYDNYYDTSKGLKAITANYSNYVGNDETRDAFFAAEKATITSSISLPVTLTRPFGQLNVLTALTDVPSDMYPAKVWITSSTPLADTFNVLEGSISTSDNASGNNFTWDAAVESIDYAVDYDFSASGNMHLSTDYIFAPAAGQQLVDFEMKFIDADGGDINTNDNFNSIPIQRNYRTNVSGELLTKQGTINVTIDPVFEGDTNISASDVATLAALQDEMEKAENTALIDASYSVANEVDADNGSVSIVIPALTGDAAEETATTSRSFELIGGIASGTTLTFEYASGTEEATAPDVVYITLPDEDDSNNTGTLVIDLPYSTVYINGTCYGLGAATYGQTLVINEGATVNGLTINKGNVDVYGTLTGTVSLGSYNNVANDSATITVYTATADVTGMTINDSDNITVIYTDPSDPIQNITSGNSYENLEVAVAAAKENEVIELAAGTYTLTQDSSKTDYYDADGFYLLIETEGLTIRGIGEVIIDSEDFTGDLSYPKQNLVTVRANNVTLENLTFYANTNAAYTNDGICYPNKTIELPSGKYFGLTVDGCTFLGADGSKTSGAGRFYLGAKNVASDYTIATIKNSTFYCGAVSVHTGVATIDNCTFNGIYYNYEYDSTDAEIYTGDGYYCAWARNGAELTITNSTFSNVKETHMETDTYGNSMIYAPIMASGDTDSYDVTTVTATGCTLPSNSGNYGYVTAANSLTINGETYLPAIYNEELKKGYDTIDEAVAAAASENTISLAAGVYDLTPEANLPLLNIDKSLTIKAASGLSASDVIIAPTYVDSSGSGYNQSTIYINYGDNFSSNIEVTFENLTLSSHIYTASSSYANKVVEARGDATLNMNYCIVTPNTYVSEYDVNYAGSVYGHGDASVNLNYCELINSSLTADNIDTSTFNIKNTTFNNSYVGTTSWESSFVPQDSKFEMYIDNCEFVNWKNGHAGTVSDNLLVRTAYGAIIITDTTFPTDDTSLYCSVLESPSYSAADGAIWGGLIEANGDIYTPTIYNYTQRQVYDTFANLSEGVKSGDELYVGAGTYALGSFGNSVTIYGANKGVAGSSSERSDDSETIFTSGQVYKAASQAKNFTATFNGVKFTDDFEGFFLEHGGNLTLENCVVSTSSANISGNVGRVFYCNNSNSNGTIGEFTFTNNLFTTGDEDDGVLNEIWMINRANGVTSTITGNVFDKTFLYVGSNTDATTTTDITISGNTFRNITGYYSSYDMTDPDNTGEKYQARAVLAFAGANVPTVNITGNTFESTVNYPFAYVGTDWQFYYEAKGGNDAYITFDDNIINE